MDADLYGCLSNGTDRNPYSLVLQPWSFNLGFLTDDTSTCVFFKSLTYSKLHILLLATRPQRMDITAPPTGNSDMYWYFSRIWIHHLSIHVGGVGNTRIIQTYRRGVNCGRSCDANVASIGRSQTLLRRWTRIGHAIARMSTSRWGHRRHRQSAGNRSHITARPGSRWHPRILDC